MKYTEVKDRVCFTIIQDDSRFSVRDTYMYVLDYGMTKLVFSIRQGKSLLTTDQMTLTWVLLKQEMGSRDWGNKSRGMGKS